jgi:4-amino-4-deoxychorismate lyase
VLKLLVSRGGGTRGYAPAADVEPIWLLSRHALPPTMPADGLRARWCETRLASQPLLAGIKHCNRLEQVLARAECVEAGTDDGLMQDDDGNAVAATSANLFVLRDGHWLTPMLDRCGVAGVCRAQLLVPLQAREARLDVATVEAADAVFLCNAVRGILPLARLGARTWLPHPAVAAARRALARLHPAFALDMERP